jgi:hypothetical protein
LVGIGTAGVGTLIYALENSIDVQAADFVAHPYSLPWSHNAHYDHNAHLIIAIE